MRGQKIVFITAVVLLILMLAGCNIFGAKEVKYNTFPGDKVWQKWSLVGLTDPLPEKFYRGTEKKGEFIGIQWTGVTNAEAELLLANLHSLISHFPLNFISLPYYDYAELGYATGKCTIKVYYVKITTTIPELGGEREAGYMELYIKKNK